MSKDKIEVGDIYVSPNGDSKIVFICVNDYYHEYLQHNTKLAESYDIYRVNDIKKAYHNKKWKYLGKSKANIDDLFKTENEECCSD